MTEGQNLLFEHPRLHIGRISKEVSFNVPVISFLFNGWPILVVSYFLCWV